MRACRPGPGTRALSLAVKGALAGHRGQAPGGPSVAALEAGRTPVGAGWVDWQRVKSHGREGAGLGVDTAPDARDREGYKCNSGLLE